jgi:hypothetical protein
LVISETPFLPLTKGIVFTSVNMIYASQGKILGSLIKPNIVIGVNQTGNDT